MKERGASIIELLVAVGIFSAIFLIISSVYMESLKSLDDQRLMAAANEEAFDLSQLIASELRHAGAGLPLTQSGFQPGMPTLGTTPLAVLLSSNNSSITIRYNEKGGDTVLVGDYAPSPSDLSFAVYSGTNFLPEDVIYLSDHNLAGEDGMFATIARISGSIIAVHNRYTASAAANFPSGSTVTRVRQVTISSSANFGGISRNQGSGAIAIGTNSEMNIEYFDQNGSSLSPPLTADQVRDNLSSIEVTVNVQASRRLHDGNTFVGSGRQRVALKNLIWARSQ